VLPGAGVVLGVPVLGVVGCVGVVCGVDPFGVASGVGLVGVVSGVGLVGVVSGVGELGIVSGVVLPGVGAAVPGVGVAVPGVGAAVPGAGAAVPDGTVLGWDDGAVWPAAGLGAGAAVCALTAIAKHADNSAMPNHVVFEFIRSRTSNSDFIALVNVRLWRK
jgi:hypothetical protein